jgi:cilia- and flagella-associated protein 57
MNKTLENEERLAEEALAVAFHPSGFHVIVGIPDKLIIYNVLSKALTAGKSIPIKGCREIQFSNGGHMFAAAYLNNAVHVYNFYTGECPQH